MITEKARVLIIVLLPAILLGCIDRQPGRVENFNLICGNYIIDLSRTDLADYAKDSALYSNCKLTFRSDSSFKMSMAVPFFYDSIGQWVAGNNSEWNWLRYGAKITPMPKLGIQFTRPFVDGTDSFILISSPAARKGMIGLRKVYFKKISRENKWVSQ